LHALGRGRGFKLRRRRTPRGTAAAGLALGLLALGFALADPAAESDPAPESAPAADSEALTAPLTIPPVKPSILATAGDIACGPDHPGFNRGRGENGKCRQLYTSRLLTEANSVLTLGDNQNPLASLRNYRRGYDRSWGRFLEITRPVIGNHDYGPPWLPYRGPGGYWDYFGKRAGDRGQGWYSFNVGEWHVIALNSLCVGSVNLRTMQEMVGCDRESPQYKWLKQDLRRHRGDCIVAAWHHPRFSSGSYENGFSQVRPFWTALDRAGADIVLSGHDHVYERFTRMHADGELSPDGIRQFTVGTGGNTLGYLRYLQPGSQEFISSYGVLMLELRPDSYGWEFVTTDGRVRDAGFTPC
jgi:acid phosphatase type 7